MKVPVYLLHINCVLLCTVGEFLNARQVNDMWNLPEDEFLPRKKRKLGFLFFFLSKKKPIRWRAYWQHRMAQYLFLVYVVVMVSGRCILGSFDFLTNSVVALYPLLMILFDLALREGTFIYVKIKKQQQRRNTVKR